MMVSAQITQVIKGTVLESNTNIHPEPIFELLNSESPIGSSTNEKGEFKLQNVPIGRWQIKIYMLGYKEKLIDHFECNG